MAGSMTSFRPIRFIALSLSAVVALLAMLLAWVLLADHEYLRDDIETYLSELLDRRVSIEGPLRIDVGKVTSFSVDGLLIEDVAGNARADFLSVGHFETSFHTFSILSDTIVVETIVLDHLRLHLQRNEAGDANWEFAAFAGNDDTDNESPAGIPLVIKHVASSDLTIEVRSPELVNTAVLNLSSVTKSLDEDSVSILDVDGDLNQTEFSIAAKIDDLAGLLDLDKVTVDLDAVLGEITLTGRIELEDLKRPNRPIVDLRLRGASVEYLTDILQLERFAHGALDVAMNVEPDGDNMSYALRGEIGEFGVGVHGHFDSLRDLQDASLVASASGPNAAALLGKFGIDGLPAEAFALDASVERSGPVLILKESRGNIGESTFDAVARFDQFPKLTGGTASINASGPDLAKFSELTRFQRSVHGEFSTTLELKSAADGVTRVQVNAEALGATVIASGALTDDPQLTGSKFDVSLRAANSATLAKLADIQLPSDFETTLDVDVERQDGHTRLTNGRLTLNDDVLRFSGTVGDQPLSGQTSLDFEITVARLMDTLRLHDLTQAEVRNEAIVVSGHIDAANDQVAIKSLRAEYANAQLSVSGTVANLSASPNAQLSAEVSGDSLGALLPGSDEFSANGKAFRIVTDIGVNERSISLQNLDVALPKLKSKGSISFARNEPLEMIDVSLTATSQDIFGFANVFTNVPDTPNVAMQFQVDGSIASREIRIDKLSASIGDAVLSAKGGVGSPPAFESSRVDVDISVPDLSVLGSLFDIDLPAQRFETELHLENDDAALRIKDFSAAMGDDVLAGDLYWLPGPVPVVRVNLTSDYLDLRPYLVGDEGQSTEVANSDQLIPDTPIPFAALKDKEIDARIEVSTLQLRRVKVRDLVLVANVKDSVLNVSEMRLADERGGKLNARMGIKALQSGGDAWFRLSGENIDLGLPSENDAARANMPRYDITAAFASTGETVKDLAGSANGYLKLVGGPGTINTGLLGAFSQDFLFELLNTLNPFLTTDPSTQLHCSVVLATVEDGLLVGNPVLVLQSERLKVLADLRANLKTERIDADFNTVAQKGVGLSLGDVVNPYVRVTGTLAAPALTLDKKAALFEGGAAVATAGISILALNFKNRFLADKDPCGEAVERASELFSDLEKKYGNAESAEEILRAGRRQQPKPE